MNKRYEQKQADPFYSSAIWRQVREERLRMDGYYCADCMAEYRAGTRMLQDVRMAEMVHHIIHRRQAPDKGLDLDNLISLCNMHHERRHPERHDRDGKRSSPQPERRFRVLKV